MVTDYSIKIQFL